MNDKQRKMIEKEIKGCFDYFWNESNGFNKNSLGYGLTLDKTTSKISSLASVGFALTAYMIGVENKYITFDEGYERVLGTLKTISRIKHNDGLLPHFVNQETGENYHSEYSTIDTAICLMGSLTASNYFLGETKQIAEMLIERVNWEAFFIKKDDKLQIIMAYSDYYWQDNHGYCHASWDQYAEQLMIYILYASKKKANKTISQALFQGFTRNSDEYNGEQIIHCYANPLFIHQFTHCFFNFEDYLDMNGFDWFNNSRKATLANRDYCLKQTWSKTYSACSWGLTAFQGEKEYKVYGAPPFGFKDNPYQQELDGSVAPYAALSSIVFTPKESLDALAYFNSIKGLNKKYGLTDCYNFEKEPFISSCYVGIDKGPTIIMLDNYLNQTTWKYFMNSEYVKRAVDNLGFTKKNVN